MLSGGERQQLAIAISLVQNPGIIIVDEPSAGVAPDVVKRIAAVLRQLSDKGAGVIVAEQDLNAFLPVATDVLVMKRGSINHAGPAEQVSPAKLWDLF